MVDISQTQGAEKQGRRKQRRMLSNPSLSFHPSCRRPSHRQVPWSRTLAGDPRLLSRRARTSGCSRPCSEGGNQQSGRGFFVEFGARNGQEESNSYFFQKVLGWHGILAEASPADQRDIATNRSHSAVINGAMCKDESKREYGELQYGLSGLVEKYDPARSGREAGIYEENAGAVLSARQGAGLFRGEDY